eukprot:15352374-Ditylum_brightwellii.AAC.1
MPLYNHYRGEDASLASYVTFDADGSIIGYQGCGQEYDEIAHFKSTVDNGAAEIQPLLCPLGSYGYHCRCRDWYVKGKKKWESIHIDGDPLYVTAPYLFADSGFLGQTNTLPLVDPKTNNHIGQILVDVSPSLIFNALTSNTVLFDDSFAFVINEDG